MSTTFTPHDWDTGEVFGFVVCKRCCRSRNEHNGEKECKTHGLRVGQQYNAHKPKSDPRPIDGKTFTRILGMMAALASVSENVKKERAKGEEGT